MVLGDHVVAGSAPLGTGSDTADTDTRTLVEDDVCVVEVKVESFVQGRKQYGML
jgi:hypothetical protein